MATRLLPGPELQCLVGAYVRPCTTDDPPQAQPIPFSEVRRTFSAMRSRGEQVYLHELLTGSEIVLDAPPPPPPPDPSLQARLEKLRARQAAKEYRSMTRNVDCRALQKRGLFGELSQEAAPFRVVLLTSVNFLISVAATFACTFLISNYLFTTPTIPLIIGIVSATLVGLAELYGLAKISAGDDGGL
uniref:transmembrane protein 199 n=1 Tax=Myxine glutinosa TaxID=7769 RepID=UPI00358E6CAA